MKKRIDMIDILRGTCLIAMVFYHFIFNLIEFGLIYPAVLFNPLVDILQICFASLFIIICGVSSTFSKDNIKRGAIIFLYALAVTFVTYMFDEIAYVKFGILHFLGLSTFLYGLIRKHFKPIKLNKYFGVLMIILFIATKLILDKPYNYNHLWIFGFTNHNFISLDYFPIFPWIFIFLLGIYLGKVIKRGKFPCWFYTAKCNFLSNIGRKSLLIYLIHQPILISITYFITLLKK